MLLDSSTEFQPLYHPSDLDDAEDVEMYRPGGFHPVSIGDMFANGRYKVLHKLGCGCSSTVWLARDQHPPKQDQSAYSGTLVALKVLSADESSKPNDEIPELTVPVALDGRLRATGYTGQNIQLIKAHFTERGPNGTHICIVYQFSGPSVFSLTYCPGRRAGSRRLNGGLARKVAKQVVDAVELMHSAGFVHGDLTTSNILFQVSDEVFRWSDETVYLTLGQPTGVEITTCDNSSPAPYAPQKLISPIDSTRFSSRLLQENIVVIDFGQSFATNLQPEDYVPVTAIHYMSPEARFESRISMASDIWGLACTLFEIRSGFSLFEPMFGSNDVLKRIVAILGKLPEPWWSAFEDRQLWFEENGEPRSMELQKMENVALPAVKSSIYGKLKEIGEGDVPPKVDEGPMIEVTGTRLEEEEVSLLGDLLGKMLKYRPEDRITIQEVVGHPWFKYTGIPKQI